MDKLNGALFTYNSVVGGLQFVFMKLDDTIISGNHTLCFNHGLYVYTQECFLPCCHWGPTGRYFFHMIYICHHVFHRLSQRKEKYVSDQLVVSFLFTAERPCLSLYSPFK